MREIAQFNELFEAEVALSFLKSRGFDVMIADNHYAATQYPVGSSIRLLAADGDVWLAKAALDERKQPSQPGQCPRCESDQFLDASGGGKVAALFLPIARLVGAVPPQGYLRCNRCSKIWRDAP